VAGQYDIFISGDLEVAKQLVANTLATQGYVVTINPNGGFTAKRGSAAATALLGALAGNNLQMTFFVQFFTAPDGSLVSRLSRNTAGAALKGGAIGAARTSNAFADLANAVTAAAQGAGTFVHSIAG
jgi:hypothetical protein